MGLSIRPAVAGGAARDSAGAPVRNRNHTSLDVTQRLGSNSLASLTVNTDFAETEVDTRRVNLTRFPLFFPEKRTFFLEGADIFDFGLGLDEDVIPFFSRRIGLFSGSEVPLDAGRKVNGRAAGASLRRSRGRARATRTRSTTEGGMGVVRMKRRTSSANRRLASSRRRAIRSDDPGAWLAGPDFTYQTSRFRGDKNFLIGVWGLGVGREDLQGDRTRRRAARWTIPTTSGTWPRHTSASVRVRSVARLRAAAGCHISRRPASTGSRGRSDPIGPLHIRQCFWENEATLRRRPDGWLAELRVLHGADQLPAGER